MRITSKPAPQNAPKAATPAPAVTGIEADVNAQLLGNDGLALTGVVKLDRGFMERLLKHVTRKTHVFGKRDLAFNPQKGTYGGTLQLKIKGRPVTFVAQAKPVADGNQPGFQLQDVGIKLGGMTIKAPFFSGLAAKLLANEITQGGITATQGDKGIVRLDPTSLLHDAGALLPGMRIDPKLTQFTVKTAPSGDVEVHLSSKAPKSTLTDTPRSDMMMELDEQAALKLFKPLLGPTYELKGVQIREGGLKLEGQTEVKPASDAINLVKGLVGLIAIANGARNVNTSPEKAMIALGLDLQLDGTRALLTPSIGAALGDLEKTLKEAGLNPVREGKALRFDFGAYTERFGIEQLEAVPGKLKGRARLDINQLIQAPILRGEA